MNPGEDKAEVSLSSEFFKKLNQQIVQKDNLIKLLQLQIKNLKAQVDESATDGQKKTDLSRTLETKEAEIKKLETDLVEQKNSLSNAVKEKDEQIQSLNRIIEDHKKIPAAAPEPLIDPRVTELEGMITRLEGQIHAAQEQRSKAEEAVNLQKQEFDSQMSLQKQGFDNQLNIQKQQFEAQIQTLKSEIQGAQKGNSETEALKGRIAGLEAELKNAAGQLAKVSQTHEPSPESQARIAELEQDVHTLKTLLAEKDEQISSMGSQASVPTGPDPATAMELAKSKTELEAMKSKISMLENQANKASQLEKLLNHAMEEVKEVQDLRAKVKALEAESEMQNQAAMKLTALESENTGLLTELEGYKKVVEATGNEGGELRRRIEDLSQKLTQRELELAKTSKVLETQKIQAGEDVATKIEIEQLTNQVADQLLVIQRFEGVLRENQERLAGREEEIAGLRQRLVEAEGAPKPIQVSSDSDIIVNFIDFFDGLDSFISQNPNAELQNLHRKLLERLIFPNQIQYLPVISEIFDVNKHIATDYFRSNKFPEKCIVFEVEKGYRQGDLVVKKAKVWVVQNLYECRSCNAMQSMGDSRFCHLCGAKIVAPSGLPVDNLPVFEPTPTTYLRFAERMIEKQDLDSAKTNLHNGLELDPNYVPILIRLGDVHALASEFTEAIDYLQRATLLKPDSKVAEKIKALEVRNTIYQQARSLNLPPEEFDKLISLIQK